MFRFYGQPAAVSSSYLVRFVKLAAQAWEQVKSQTGHRSKYKVNTFR